MFREMRRFKQSRPDRIEEVLREAKRGVLAVNGDDGYPYAVPVNFVYVGGKIYIHGTAVGHKAESIAACDKVCFTAWRDDYRKKGDWSMYVTSVVAFCRAKLVEDRQEVLAKIAVLAEKYYPTREEIDFEIARDGHRVQLYELVPEHITAKQVHEK